MAFLFQLWRCALPTRLPKSNRHVNAARPTSVQVRAWKANGVKTSDKDGEQASGANALICCWGTRGQPSHNSEMRCFSESCEKCACIEIVLPREFRALRNSHARIFFNSRGSDAHTPRTAQRSTQIATKTSIEYGHTGI